VRPKRERELTTHWLFTRNGVARVLPSTGAMPVVAAGWLYSARGRRSIRGRNQKSPTATPSEGLAASACAEAEPETRTANVAAAISLGESAPGNVISPHRDRHFEHNLVG